MEAPDETGRVEDVPRPARLWNMTQASAFLGVSKRTLTRWIQDGPPVTDANPFPEPVPCFRPGNEYKFDPHELRAWRDKWRVVAP